MFINGIPLDDAMTREIPPRVRAWEVSGLHIEGQNIPEDLLVSKTYVLKLSDSCWQVGIESVEGLLKVLSEFSSLEELQKQFPHLFELEGDLYAFV